MERIEWAVGWQVDWMSVGNSVCVYEGKVRERQL